MSKKVIELLKSGNFTLLYHETDNCTLHKGHIKYDQSDEGHPEYVPEIAEIGGDSDIGYAPKEVVILVKALGGKVYSI